MSTLVNTLRKKSWWPVLISGFSEAGGYFGTVYSDVTMPPQLTAHQPARSPTRLGTALAYDGTTLLVQGEATQSPCVLTLTLLI
jgi:hypothetical protein